MRYTSNIIVDKFVDGDDESASSSSGNLKIKGSKLIHYDTVIAERNNNKIFLNLTRYSLQTGRIQKILREKIPQNLLVEVTQVPKDHKGSLLEIIEKQA